MKSKEILHNINSINYDLQKNNNENVKKNKKIGNNNSKAPRNNLKSQFSKNSNSIQNIEINYNNIKTNSTNQILYKNQIKLEKPNNEKIIPKSIIKNNSSSETSGIWENCSKKKDHLNSTASSSTNAENFKNRYFNSFDPQTANSFVTNILSEIKDIKKKEEFINEDQQKKEKKEEYSIPKKNEPFFAIFTQKLLVQKISDRIWYYRDPRGIVQGPFSSVEMDLWNSDNYFPDHLPISWLQYKQFISIEQFKSNPFLLLKLAKLNLPNFKKYLKFKNLQNHESFVNHFSGHKKEFFFQDEREKNHHFNNVDGVEENSLSLAFSPISIQSLKPNNLFNNNNSSFSSSSNSQKELNLSKPTNINNENEHQDKTKVFSCFTEIDLKLMLGINLPDSNSVQKINNKNKFEPVFNFKNFPCFSESLIGDEFSKKRKSDLDGKNIEIY